jgi:hypothetical protein
MSQDLESVLEKDKKLIEEKGQEEKGQEDEVNGQSRENNLNQDRNNLNQDEIFGRSNEFISKVCNN